ncbi:MAG: serine/threonine-protein kinase [Polyangiaceae bacterium]
MADARAPGSLVARESTHDAREMGRRYVLGREIAIGGMATVHLGKQLGDKDSEGRTVAIKRLHRPFARDLDFLRMFMDEARLATFIKHPNVAATLDLMFENGEFSLVLEYIHGASLAELLRAVGGPIPAPIAATIMIDTLHGLGAAHDARGDDGVALEIIHRDVSPQNILVGVDGAARVVDFGVAKATVRLQTTREGQTKGKLAYMAPEQLLTGSEIDRRADIYSAGVLLAELLTGKKVFAAENEAQLMLKVLSGVVDLPSKLAPGVGAAWDDIVERAVALAPASRYPSAGAMAEAIDAAIEKAPRDVVARWVASTCAALLEQRNELERALDAKVAGRAATAGDATKPTPEERTLRDSSLTASTPQPKRQRSLWIPAFVVLAVALGIVVVYRMRTQPTEFRVDETSQSAAAALETPRTVEPSKPPLESASAASSTAALASASAPEAPRSARSTPTVHPTVTAASSATQARPSAKSTAAANCKNPLYVDSAGITRVRRECLK